VVFGQNRVRIEAAGYMHGVVNTAVTALKTDKTGLGFSLFPWTLGIQNKCHAAYRQVDIIQHETGQIKFQDDLATVFIHVHEWTILTFVIGVTQLECMQEAAYLADVTTENFLMERLLA
jgi:hypothetical protein